ncbi:hypothetical protein Tco_0947598 [Tanacetum coccineum]
MFHLPLLMNAGHPNCSLVFGLRPALKHLSEIALKLHPYVNKFLGTIKFRNDHVEKILGYGDYQIRNVTISRVYYVEGLGHNLFFVGHGLVRGLPKLKFEKDHLCSACAMGKSKKKPHKPKSEDTIKNTLSFAQDLCGQCVSQLSKDEAQVSRSSFLQDDPIVRLKVACPTKSEKNNGN